MNHIAFGELECLYAVVVLGLCVAPTSSVCADHVGSVADRAEIEAVVLAGDHLWVAHADCDPVRGGLLDPEGEFLDGVALLEAWLHDDEFVAGVVGGGDQVIGDDLDVWMLERWRKLEHISRLPNRSLVCVLIELGIVLLQQLADLIDIGL